MSATTDKLVAYLHEHGHNTDVAIVDLYYVARGATARNVRYAQQYLGAFISRINRKVLKGEKIIPGQVKHTYRIVRTDTE